MFGCLGLAAGEFYMMSRCWNKRRLRACTNYNPKTPKDKCQEVCAPFSNFADILNSDVSYSLNSLKGGYIGDYIRDYYRGY